MSFSNKVVIVTGSSSGIGAATALLFTKEGASVAIVGRNVEKLKSIEEKCSKIGKRPLVIKADVSIDEEANKVIKETVEKFGRLDILINNAGMGKAGSILDGKALEAYDTVMHVNVRAIINLTILAAPYLVKSKGQIINVSSVVAKSVPVAPELMPYSVSKAALDHFTKCIALELAPSGVRVNSVNPGPVVTDFFEVLDMDLQIDQLANMTALKRISQADEIADIILFLVSDKAKGMTGSIVVHDNGYLLTHQ